MQWIGYIGLAALVICWIPQSVETIKRGRCQVNLYFLILSSLGSLSLMIYAVTINDAVFSILNAMTTLGALVNLYYRVFPRASSAPS